MLASVEHCPRKSCPCWGVLKGGAGTNMEGAIDCIEAVEVIGGTRSGVMVLSMGNSGERVSLFDSF